MKESHHGSPRAAQGVALLLALLSLSLVFGGMHRVILGDSANSRLASVWSLDQAGTWRIDLPGNPFAAKMVDKVEVGGRLLSTKPPLLPLAMAGEYALMRHFLSWDLKPEGDLKRVVQVMTATLIGGTYGLGLVAFYLLLGLFMTRPWCRTAVFFAFAFGTQIPGFATQINNHTPAAALLLITAYLGIAMGTGRVKVGPWRLVAFGFCGAWVFALDMPLTIFVAALFIYAALRFPLRGLTWIALGAAPVLVTHFAIMWVVTGSPLPVQMRKELYLFESSYWRNPLGVDALHEPRATYLFHMTFGRYGSFLLFPVLLTGLAGLVRSFFPAYPYRGATWAAAAAFALLTAYYALRTNNYGGAAYGFRWYIGVMPVLLLMGAPVVDRCRKRWQWGVLLLLMAVSCYSAYACYRMPWGTGHEWTCRLLFGSGLP